MQEAMITACRAARAGGAILRNYFGQPLAIQEKQGADIVMEADLAAEETICAVLRASHPDFGILSEEQGLTTGEAEYRWVVDPLDGTNNFVVGIPQFDVSIALTQQQVILTLFRGFLASDFVISKTRRSKMSDPMLERIQREAGIPDLIEVLVERLAPTDLQSLLLEVSRRRAARVQPGQLFERYEHDRFVRPSAVSPSVLADFDRLVWSLLPDHYAAISYHRFAHWGPMLASH